VELYRCRVILSNNTRNTAQASHWKSLEAWLRFSTTLPLNVSYIDASLQHNTIHYNTVQCSAVQCKCVNMYTRVRTHSTWSKDNVGWLTRENIQGRKNHSPYHRGWDGFEYTILLIGPTTGIPIVVDVGGRHNNAKYDNDCNTIVVALSGTWIEFVVKGRVGGGGIGDCCFVDQIRWQYRWVYMCVSNCHS
jgi:hypothetical protein